MKGKLKRKSRKGLDQGINLVLDPDLSVNTQKSISMTKSIKRIRANQKRNTKREDTAAVSAVEVIHRVMMTLFSAVKP